MAAMMGNLQPQGELRRPEKASTMAPCCRLLPARPTPNNNNNLDIHTYTPHQHTNGYTTTTTLLSPSCRCQLWHPSSILTLLAVPAPRSACPADKLLLAHPLPPVLPHHLLGCDLAAFVAAGLSPQ